MPMPQAAPLSRRGEALAALPVNATHKMGIVPVADGSALLAPGVPAHDLFPATTWATSAARMLRHPAPDRWGYPDPQGLPTLRLEIASYLASIRGLIADPAHIFVTSGTQQALRIAAELLLDPGDQAWVEDPGYVAGRGALSAAGARLVGVPSDTDGIDVAAGIKLAPAARLALVAPSHATPLGGALPVARRLALLDWATRAGAWLLEDDCDSEFRWEGKPLPPLATLDRTGRVIYCGTFSKTLAPALRLGFAVVPPPLTAAFVRARGLSDRGPASLPQAVLADVMKQGLLAPHVRRTRTEYATRRNALLAALAAHCPMISPVAAPGGLHMVGRLPPDIDEAAVANACRARGLAVAPLSAYFVGAPRMRGLVMGFATTPVALASETARRLAVAIRGA
jgi:GntR family transcriptional regulator/MocR family aminotransferase